MLLRDHWKYVREAKGDHRLLPAKTNKLFHRKCDNSLCRKCGSPLDELQLPRFLMNCGDGAKMIFFPFGQGRSLQIINNGKVQQHGYAGGYTRFQCEVMNKEEGLVSLYNFCMGFYLAVNEEKVYGTREMDEFTTLKIRNNLIIRNKCYFCMRFRRSDWRYARGQSIDP